MTRKSGTGHSLMQARVDGQDVDKAPGPLDVRGWSSVYCDERFDWKLPSLFIDHWVSVG